MKKTFCDFCGQKIEKPEIKVTMNELVYDACMKCGNRMAGIVIFQEWGILAEPDKDDRKEAEEDFWATHDPSGGDLPPEDDEESVEKQGSMTREEAIEYLKRADTTVGQTIKTRTAEALEMAIEALKQDPCGKDINVPATDAISRQAVLSEIEVVCFSKEWIKFRVDYGSHGVRDYIIKYVKDMPSVQPEIIRCCQCKYAEVADSEDSQDGYTCQFHQGSIWFSGSYCSWAERSEPNAGCN